MLILSTPQQLWDVSSKSSSLATKILEVTLTRGCHSEVPMPENTLGDYLCPWQPVPLQP